MTSATKTRKLHKQQPRIARLQQHGDNLVLWIAVGNNADGYKLTPIANDFGRAAYRLHKGADGKHPAADYDVLIDGEHSTCDCPAGAYRGKCKHVEALTALIAAGKLQPAPKPQAEREPGVEDESKARGCPCCGCSPEACDCWQDP